MSTKSALFASSFKGVNDTSATQSQRPVTIPYLPELYQPLEQVLDTLFPNVTPSVPAAAAVKIDVPPNSFMDALKQVHNRTKTTNSAAAYKSTLDPTLDAFSSLSQSTSPKDIPALLDASWTANPEVTLRIIWNLRSIHEGKSAREPFYRAFAWLYKKHPKTAIANLRYIVDPCVKRTFTKKPMKEPEAEDDMEVITMEEATDAAAVEKVTTGMSHGYWKDLLNILLLAARDEIKPDIAKFDVLHVYTKGARVVQQGKREKTKQGRGTVQAAPKNDKDGSTSINTETPTDLRLEKHLLWHTTVTEKLQNDTSFRALYITVARLFADALARDLAILRQIADETIDEKRRIALSFELSLAGKWAPSLSGSHDRVTNIATPIAEMLYTGGHLITPTPHIVTNPLTPTLAHQLRSMYARWALSPLRRFLQVPEVPMSANEWNKIKYTRVPSKCMQLNKNHFFKHDGKRFTTYLADVAQGKKKISGATLLPHELLKEAIDITHQKDSPIAKQVGEIRRQVVDAQWNALVERVKESGTLDNALAVCDVSGSMGYLDSHCSKDLPIFPAVALSILLSKVARPPWANTFITFSEYPEIVMLEEQDGLAETANKMIKTAWGMNTNYNAVFSTLILPMAVENKLKPEDMIKRLFVFSDMQFDNSRKRGSRWQTEHQIIKKKFNDAGYDLPELVFWNLAGAVAKPITKDDEGVALVSGFSPGMLKVFLDEGSVSVEDEGAAMVVGEDGEVQERAEKRLDPIETMMKALGKESFGGLRVMD